MSVILFFIISTGPSTGKFTIVQVPVLPHWSTAVLGNCSRTRSFCVAGGRAGPEQSSPVDISFVQLIDTNQDRTAAAVAFRLVEEPSAGNLAQYT